MKKKLISKEQFYFFLNHEIPFPHIQPFLTRREIALGVIEFLSTTKTENGISLSKKARYIKLAQIIGESVPGNGKVITVKITSDIGSRIGSKTTNSRKMIPTNSEASHKCPDRYWIKYNELSTFYPKLFIIKNDSPTVKSGWKNLNEVFPNFKF